jgi:N utilization substance protein B
MGKRREAREWALKSLYLMDSSGLPAKQAWRAVRAEKIDDKRAGEEEAKAEFAKALVLGAHEKRREIDRAIGAAAKNWNIERMAVVDRNILRLAAYELLYGDAPKASAINEAIEIARKYSTEESTKFINGILDKIRAMKHDPEEDPRGHRKT